MSLVLAAMLAIAAFLLLSAYIGRRETQAMDIEEERLRLKKEASLAAMRHGTRLLTAEAKSEALDAMLAELKELEHTHTKMKRMLDEGSQEVVWEEWR